MTAARAGAVAVVVALAGCRGEPPCCADVERGLRAVVAGEPRPTGDARFVPVFTPDAADELVALCRTGALAPATVRCLTAATRAGEVDRCVARDPSLR